RRWPKARGGLRQELGRDPTEEELAGASGLSRKELGALRQALPLLRNAGPEGVPEERGLSLEGTLPDARSRGPEAGPAAAEERRQVREAVGARGGRKALGLRLRYGLGGEGALALHEVGPRLRLT